MWGFLFSLGGALVEDQVGRGGERGYDCDCDCEMLLRSRGGK